MITTNQLIFFLLFTSKMAAVLWISVNGSPYLFVPQAMNNMITDRVCRCIDHNPILWHLEVKFKTFTSHCLFSQGKQRDEYQASKASSSKTTPLKESKQQTFPSYIKLDNKTKVFKDRLSSKGNNWCSVIKWLH